MKSVEMVFPNTQIPQILITPSTPLGTRETKKLLSYSLITNIFQRRHDSPKHSVQSTIILILYQYVPRYNNVCHVSVCSMLVPRDNNGHPISVCVRRICNSCRLYTAIVLCLVTRKIVCPEIAYKRLKIK